MMHIKFIPIVKIKLEASTSNISLGECSENLAHFFPAYKSYFCVFRLEKFKIKNKIKCSRYKTLKISQPLKTFQDLKSFQFAPRKFLSFGKFVSRILVAGTPRHQYNEIP
uniref:Uncharacterized protein n=1 Tax=Photinus pyralis TaxID=7054 RepID=A0A1Y1KF68_PHOPY